jgi:hypothetical protein
MSKDQVKQPEIAQGTVSAVGDAFDKFLDSHIAAGHHIRMCLDPKGNFVALLCLTCDPTIADRFQTRH